MAYAYKTNFGNNLPYITNIKNNITMKHNVRTETLTNGSVYGSYQAASATSIKYTSDLSLDKKYNKINSSYTVGSKDNTYSDWKSGNAISTTASYTGNHAGRCQSRASYTSGTVTTTITFSNGNVLSLSI